MSDRHEGTSTTATVPEHAVPENAVLARLFDETAELLEAQSANEFRVRAYREAADELRSLPVAVRSLWETGGRDELVRIPRIGASLSRAIETWLLTGTLGILGRLRGDESAERVLRTVPGIGPELAQRIHHDLRVSTLEELAVAAHDGRLAGLEGIGPRRLRAIRDQLDARLRSARREPGARAPAHAGPEHPPVAELLDIDREYREGAAAGRLPRIAPKRFNPRRERWLPVLHATRGGRHYTALFSNTARAHALERTRDWVVIFVDDGDGERQWTVVTETRGPLAGQRVVRGREREHMV